MNRVIKIIIILVMTFTMFSNVSATFAAQVEGTDTTGSDERTYGWSDKGLSFWKPEKVNVGQYEFNNTAKTIVAAIRAIGIVVSVIALIVIGIRQITASAEEKSIIKEAMPGYILGLILVVSITFLPTIIYNFMQKLD